MHYPINEIFQTIQGEGYYAGTPSIFIRLQGCPVHCKWCDTKYTWECNNQDQISYEKMIMKKKSNRTWSYMNSKEIILIIKTKKWTAKHVVITGGEPCLYDLLEITKELEKKDYKCQIETSGTELIRCSLNTWITLSPKTNKKALNTSILRSNEIKYPVLKEEDLFYLKSILKKIKNKKNNFIFLQPISQNEEALNICIKTCIIKNWRLSIQIHKYLKIQ
ncbi:7-carboxy-7-deazaguanine synthase QueE [Buchnera aphidicola (Rhopalosiphum padi)]|uniref:7-carboxy-7-deazaguanine synthase n=1 Tax=Buchnera aphidicola subsp. Rhopalosiphum padi TaxID=98793 RepID=A0A4D6Y6C7_BUCRP|nr:7-carboxy-7-deazaguanine synthase QueE [Buchnera aphidicola]QCI25047.1 7-carboxy-7-deazaguanine synthase QueE [Buchnera aphidicola (Rhopalosiphum padi)]